MEIQLKELLETVAALETRITRQEKQIRKIKKEMIPESERKVRQPSGFAKPTYLSPALCEFLDISVGEELPRTEVTKRVLSYVKEKALQNPTERRVINMDDKLGKLLNPAEGEQVTYFTIQRLLRTHYIKPVEPVPEPVVPAAPVVPAVPAAPAKKAPAKRASSAKGKVAAK